MPGWIWPLAALGFALYAALAALAQHIGWAGSLCWWKTVTGVPCPTCGTGTGLLALLAGEPARAWAANPLVFTALALAAIGLVVAVARPDNWVPRRFFWPLVGAAVGANWLYLLISNLPT